MGLEPGLGNDTILCPSYKLPKSKKKVCLFVKTFGYLPLPVVPL